MTATVIDFPRRIVQPPYRGRCDECGVFRYHPIAERLERWAISHSQGYHHTVRLADGRVFSVVNCEGVIYGTD